MQEIMTQGFETRAIIMEPMWRISFIAPIEDIDRIFDAVRVAVPLVHGKTGNNGYRSLGGIEYYRPLEGTPTGAEEGIRRRPDVDTMRFMITRDTGLLDAVIEAIYAVSSYYEPVIEVDEVLRSQTKGLDDSDNPHR